MGGQARFAGQQLMQGMQAHAPCVDCCRALPIAIFLNLHGVYMLLCKPLTLVLCHWQDYHNTCSYGKCRFLRQDNRIYDNITVRHTASPR